VSRTAIRAERVDSLFEQGRKVAKAADQGLSHSAQSGSRLRGRSVSAACPHKEASTSAALGQRNTDVD